MTSAVTARISYLAASGRISQAASTLSSGCGYTGMRRDRMRPQALRLPSTCGSPWWQWAAAQVYDKCSKQGLAGWQSEIR